MTEGTKEGNVLFNDALNTFYLRLYGVRHMVKDHSEIVWGYPLPPHGLLFRLIAMVLLYAPSHRQDCTYHGLCYTSRGALAETRNSSMGPPHEGSIQRPIAQWANALTKELHLDRVDSLVVIWENKQHYKYSRNSSKCHGGSRKQWSDLCRREGRTQEYYIRSNNVRIRRPVCRARAA